MFPGVLCSRRVGEALDVRMRVEAVLALLLVSLFPVGLAVAFRAAAAVYVPWLML